MQTYVTFDPATGALTGAYIQEPPEQHADCMIEVEPEVHAAWTTYRANAARDGLEIIPPAPLPEPIDPMVAALKGYEVAVQDRMETVARAWGYDSLMTAVTYAGSSVSTRFQREGQALLDWRSLVWIACHDILAQYQRGEIAAPTHAELIALLPAAPEQEPISVA